MDNENIIRIPDQIILDFRKPKLAKMRQKFGEFLNKINSRKLVPNCNATGALVELLKTEIERS